MSKCSPVTTGVPQQSVLELVLFNIFVSDTNSENERPISEYDDDTNLCDAVHVLEGRDAIQRDLDRLERWVCANLMKFNKAKRKVLHMGWYNLMHKYGLRGECIESGLEENDLGVQVDERLNMTSQSQNHRITECSRLEGTSVGHLV